MIVSKIEPYIETFTGRHFYFLDPTDDMIDIEDIAHALSMQCRFTGHTSDFYSVAEHCVHVSYLAKDQLQGLLHDASEAYLTDVASPVKPYLQNYKAMEETIMSAVATKFGFDWPMSTDTHDADRTQLKAEARALLKSKGQDWVANFPTRRVRGRTPRCYRPQDARRYFLERYYELQAQGLRAA